MRSRQDELLESLLTAEDPGATWEHSVLLIIAARMHGEMLRFQLVSHGCDVDVARAVSIGLHRVAGGSYDALVLDWQTLEVEYVGAARNEIWTRLVAEAKRAGVG